MKNQVSNDCAIELICKRFDQLCQRCINTRAYFNSDLICEKILTLYNQPARRYHNIEHIIHCLKEFDQIGDQIPDPDAVEMALWFHDSIYFAGRIDNEQKSAEFFLEQTQDYLPPDFIEKVQRLIMTTTHKEIPQNLNECFITDIDLSSFGSEWGDFMIDTQNLRDERQDLPDPTYFQIHTKFLTSLLARERIFQTDSFYNRYESIAKQNIIRLLDKRKSEGYG